MPFRTKRTFSAASTLHGQSPRNETQPFLSKEGYDIELGSPNVYHDESENVPTRNRSFENGGTGYPLPARSSSWMRRWRSFSSTSSSPLTGLGISNPCGRRASRSETGKPRRSCASRTFWTFAYFCMFLGLLQFIALIGGLVTAYFPEVLIRNNEGDVNGLYRWPTDFTADIHPVSCHSHNDYWRKVPVISALKAGCNSVEADVWLYGDKLYVGHMEPALTPNRTFTHLYVNTLLEILEKQNPITSFHPRLDEPRRGVFDTDDTKTTVLLVDFKRNGEDTWNALNAELEPLRSRKYLSYFNGSAIVPGPLTVVGTGNTPFHILIQNTTYRDIFYDAPLHEMHKINGTSTTTLLSPTFDESLEKAYLSSITGSTPREPESGNPPSPSDPKIYTPFNSYYTSTSLTATIGVPFPYFTASQRKKVAAQIEGAHAQGLKVRYWGVPAWPIAWRNYLWRELVKGGADVLNVDDLKSATKGMWRSRGLISGWWVNDGWY